MRLSHSWKLLVATDHCLSGKVVGREAERGGGEREREREREHGCVWACRHIKGVIRVVTKLTNQITPLIHLRV